MESNNPNTEETRPFASQPGEGEIENTRPTQPEAMPAPEAEAEPAAVTAPAQEEALVESSETAAPIEPPAAKKRRATWILWAVLGVVLLSMIAVTSGYAGYLSAIDLRTANQATQDSGDAQTQFDLGVQDLEAGHYDLARQRFEYVISIDPNFPGVTDKLADVLMRMSATATPTIMPTPTLTPTPDLRSQEVIFTQAQAQLLARDWSGAIDTLLTLRKRFVDYRAVEVDGMLFVALRNRGVDKISLQADLEGGIYDLALADRFGPIDVEARNWSDWAELYIRGASFWDVDWQQAVFYFSQLAQIAPNLMDGSRYTATERYRLALIGYGDWFALQELWCEAQEQYDLAYNMSPLPELEPTARNAADECSNPTPRPQVVVATETPTPTATLEGGVIETPVVVEPTATEAPVVDPTATPTEQPPGGPNP